MRAPGQPAARWRASWEFGAWQGCSSDWSSEPAPTCRSRSTAKPVERAGRRPPHHGDPASSPGICAASSSARAPRRLLHDGGVPGLLGAPRRRAAGAGLLDAGRTRHGGDRRGDRMAEPVVAVVGAGPAGVRAAETLARAGVKPHPDRRGRAARRPDLPAAAGGRGPARHLWLGGPESRRHPPRAGRARRQDRLPTAHARLEPVPGPARPPDARRIRRSSASTG